jgi:hypothetical protein
VFPDPFFGGDAENSFVFYCVKVFPFRAGISRNAVAKVAGEL